MDAHLLDDFSGFSDEKLKKWNIFQTSRFFLDVYCLKPGQSQRAHSHADADKIYIVLDGKCRFTIGAEIAEYGKNAAVLARAGISHGVENSGKADARLLVMMTPPPRE